MRNSAQVTLAIIVTFCFFFCIFFMLKWEFPITNKDALNSLLGVLTTIFTLQMNFFFGSSSASKAKDDIIGDIAKIPVAPTSPTSPINIPDAKTVTVKTETGDVTVSNETNEAKL